MMDNAGAVGTLLLIFTGLMSYKAFRDPVFMERYAFDIDGILLDKQYDRMITSGFLHVGWLHFGFNMIALLSFSRSLETLFGYGQLLGIYFGSMLGGNLLALYLHRNHGDYRAVGASGAISGVIFASIILFPLHSLSFVIIPFEIKNWIFGLLFMLVSIFGIKRQNDQIGHEAHLGGALTGILITVIITWFLDPSILKNNWWIIVALTLPTLAFLLLVIRNPAVLMIKNYWGEGVYKVRNNLKKNPTPTLSKEKELDLLLDKIRTKGFKNLSKQEKDRLNELREHLK